MLKWLLPKEVSFFEYFENLNEIIISAAIEFNELVLHDNLISEKANRIKDLEHKADQITHQCIEKIHQTFITPFQRDDILHLISSMDDIIDLTKDTASRIVIYQLNQMTPLVQRQAQCLLSATKELKTILFYLKNPKKITSIKDVFCEINRIENEADNIHLQALSQLFSEGQDTSIILKWKDIYENIENAIDRCEDVANIIEGLILEAD